jgi:hypothetical protein
VAAVGGEVGVEAIADEDRRTVNSLDMLVEGGVARDHACQMSHLVQDSGEQVVATVAC